MAVRKNVTVVLSETRMFTRGCHSVGLPLRELSVRAGEDGVQEHALLIGDLEGLDPDRRSDRLPWQAHLLVVVKSLVVDGTTGRVSPID